MFDRDAAWAWMAESAGTRYGWTDFFRDGIRRHTFYPINRLAARPNSNDPRVPRFCSERVAAALRQFGGPVFKEFDCDVEPGDVDDESCMTYIGTLYATAAQANAAIS
jgi:hypothetical protein